MGRHAFDREPEHGQILQDRYANAMTRERLAGVEQGWNVPVAAWRAPAGFHTENCVADLPDNLITYRTAGSTVEGWRTGPVRREIPTAGCVAIVPARVPVTYLTHGPIRFVHLYLSTAFLHELAQAVHGADTGDGAYLLRDDREFAEDRQLRQATDDYLRRAFDPDLPTTLEMDARATLIGLRTIEAHSVLPSRETPHARGGLASWQQRRATEYLSANLSKDVSLAALAGVAQLSPYHFARSFKQSTGLAPHAYLRRLRLERAKVLLADTDLPVTEIALSVGYVSSQALARLFQREVGVSPSQYRRERIR